MCYTFIRENEKRGGSNRFIAQGAIHLTCVYLWSCMYFVERFELYATPAVSIYPFVLVFAYFHKLFTSLPSRYVLLRGSILRMVQIKPWHNAQIRFFARRTIKLNEELARNLI